MIDGRYHMQQLARLGKIVLAFGIGEQTVVPDAMKATGQDMQQEASHELVRIKRHGLVARLSFGPIILPTESNAVLVQAQ
jgi:hypothetical protein